MTEDQTNSETQSPETQSIPRRRRSLWRWVLATVGVLLGTCVIVAICLALTPKHKAEARVQIRSVHQSLLFGEYQQDVFCSDRYEKFVNTQFALMRSPQVIGRALEQPEVARLPIIQSLRTDDRRDWIVGRLRLNLEGQSEIANISITTNSADASEAIVNAVVHAYLEFIREYDRAFDANRLLELRTERRRHEAVARSLREQITALTRELTRMRIPAGSEAIDEFLLRELRAAESQLVVLQARRTALAELTEQPDIDREIQTQQRLVQELERKFEEQLEADAARSEEEVRIAFLQNELRRTETVLDRIDDRIVAIQAEARAPSRINLISHAVSSRR